MNVFRVRLCEEDIKKLSERASELGLAPSALARMWITEGLNRTDSALFITQVVHQAMREVLPDLKSLIKTNSRLSMGALIAAAAQICNLHGKEIEHISKEEEDQILIKAESFYLFGKDIELKSSP